MNNNIIIRKETKEDYYNAEHMTMRAFWNIHGPGCNEHLLVHKLRTSPDYLPELSRVAELDGRIVGAIYYSKSKVVDGDKTYDVLTFGPLAVEPTCFSMGIGAKLLAETIKLAKETDYPGIVICGEPDYYPKHGFELCDKFDIHHPAFGNSEAFMAYPLKESFKDVHGMFYEAPIFEECEDEAEIADFTKEFPYYRPLKLSCQWLHKERLGRISDIRKNSFTIRYFEKDLPAKLKGTFDGTDAEKLPVVGDYVTFQYNPVGDSVILSVCERTSLLQRPDQAKTGVMQYMVANADYLFIVTSLNEDYSYNRIARYVSVALQGQVTPVVILTKSDLCSNPGRFVREVESISDKVKVHAISALYEIGLDELQEYYTPGTTICLMGSSGAGKSTLLNAITGKETMKTGAIRESDSTGKHTTTNRQLIDINGISVIDTPGMREIGVTGSMEGIEDTFSDIIELEACCRFSNCKHESEPGCAIKAAIADGSLSAERYELYKNLGSEHTRNYAKKKEISKWAKVYKKVAHNGKIR
ncbi:MAG: ribosome small subunit-dependent GTPase A [Lachnospiraceae bacterium]|nr:ribosome small subunit-dependent GTPase A [Lachnospiraceae bacterium]